MKVLLLFGLLFSAQAFPSQTFTDGGFQPIAPPPDAVISRARSLPINKDVEFRTSASGISSVHSPGKIFGGHDRGFNSHQNSAGFGGHSSSFSGKSGSFGGNSGGFGGKSENFDFGGSSNGFHAGGRNFHQSSNLHAGSTPTKTIYVNVPSEPIYEQPKPIVAGPPRKHYRIVFIKSPAPPPPPQPILPPRVEQKTLIYILHPKSEYQHKIIEVPETVQHDPEVYFIKYEDKPPTPEELQGFVKNSINSYNPSDVDFSSGNFKNSQGSGYSGQGNSFKSAGSGILSSKSSHQGTSSKSIPSRAHGGPPRVSNAYSSSINHGGKDNSGLRYNRTPQKPKNKAKFEGPFAGSRYERSDASVSVKSTLGKGITKANRVTLNKSEKKDSTSKSS